MNLRQVKWMNKAFENILERFKQLKGSDSLANMFISDVIKVIKSIEEEYNNGWIPCSERLPDDFMSFEYLTMRKGHTLATISYYCVVNNKWYSSRNSTKEIEVIAWQQLPEPYKENE